MKFLNILIFALSTLLSNAQTQAEMNIAAIDSYHKTDKQLNDIYKQILVKYKSDTIFIKNLKASQRIWITFRDAELKMKFPEKVEGFYGSIHPVCVAGYLEKLTRQRILTLSAWIDGYIEGDACNGSIKNND